LKLVREEAADIGLALDVSRIVLENYEYLEERGFGDLGTHALIKYYKGSDANSQGE
jgi:3-hydroxyisobutyrate dehydrogenase-like beta-hydroxyacid dehydrogenase